LRRRLSSHTRRYYMCWMILSFHRARYIFEWRKCTYIPIFSLSPRKLVSAYKNIVSSFMETIGLNFLFAIKAGRGLGISGKVLLILLYVIKKACRSQADRLLEDA